MGKQTVNIGIVANDGTGDPIRNAFDKCNDNFDELYALPSNATHTGDATGSNALTLATVNANVGSFDNATVTVNAKGLVTAASEKAHTGDATGATALTLATVNANVGSFDNATITVNGKGLVTAASEKAHTGDATGATALTLATVNANVGAFTLANVTVNAKGLVTAASTTLAEDFADVPAGAFPTLNQDTTGSAGSLSMAPGAVGNVLTSDGAGWISSPLGAFVSCTRLLSDNVQHTNTGDTNENTVFTDTIPASSIGIDGSFIIHALWSGTNGADDKILRVKFNGTAVMTMTMTTSASASLRMELFNRHSASAQVAAYIGNGNNPFFISAGPLATYTINTAADITVTVTLQNETAGNANNLEAFEILGNP